MAAKKKKTPPKVKKVSASGKKAATARRVKGPSMTKARVKKMADGTAKAAKYWSNRLDRM